MGENTILLKNNLINPFEPNDNKENIIINCLTNSLNIFEKIQKQFENSAKNNTNNLEEKRLQSSSDIISVINKTISSDPTKCDPLVLESLGLSVKLLMKKISYFQILNISEYEKTLIRNQIEENSNSRIKNYSNLFNIINVTLEDIKDSVKQMNLIQQLHKELELEKGKTVQKRYSFATNDVKALKVDFGFSENSEEHVKILKEGLRVEPPIDLIYEDSCDFSEASMFENAVVVPPKLENRYNILKTKEITSEQYNTISEFKKKEPYQSKDKNNNQTIEEAICEHSLNDDNTIVEYSSLFLDIDDINDNLKKENSKINPVNGFSKAKTIIKDTKK